MAISAAKSADRSPLSFKPKALAGIDDGKEDESEQVSMKGCQLVIRNHRENQVKIEKQIAGDYEFDGTELKAMNDWQEAEMQIWSSAGSVETNGEVLKLESSNPLAKKGEVSDNLAKAMVELRNDVCGM